MLLSKTDTPRITIRLKGGLGNQLFMYAFAKSLSLKNNVPLKLDVKSGFSSDKTYHRQYLLHHFPLEDEISSDWDSYCHFLGERRRKYTIKFNNLIPLMKRNYIKEQVRAFDKEIFDLPIERPIYFEGYWQSYRYFESIEGTIKERLVFNLPLTSETLEEARSIESCNAVCLGIRRFDEVPLKVLPRKKILGPDYFLKAMELIADIVPDPHFFLFTQDIDWAMQTLPSTRHKISFIKQKDPHLGAVTDLWLMTLCKLYIISNSTLHWWGAWLNNNPEKAIIAPKDGWGTEDILPSSWKVLDYNYL